MPESILKICLYLIKQILWNFFTNLNQFLLYWSRILLHEGNDLKTSELIVIFFFFIRCHFYCMFFLTLFCCRSSFSCYVNICLFLYTYHLHTNLHVHFIDVYSLFSGFFQRISDGVLAVSVIFSVIWGSLLPWKLAYP